MIMMNGDGSYRKVVIIGKTKSPRNITPEFWKEFDIEYFSNKKSWMLREIFTKFLLDFDSQLNKKIILILDNFSGHKFNESVVLKNVVPCYLPPNTTSKTQPLDAGIICNIKIKYRNYMVTYSLGKMLERNLDQTKSISSLSFHG